MGTKDKLISRFKNLPSSRVIFKDDKGNPIMVHKPHPGNVVKAYAMKQIYEELVNKGKI